MPEFPKFAKVVIVGQGGIVGASVAYHLAQLGWDGIVGIDKSTIPTEHGSTSHASDFCYMTSHSKLSVFTSMYSQQFYSRMGHFAKCGGMEIARVGDNERMEELKRKVGTGKAFGTNVSLITPREAKEKFPLLKEDLVQGAMWDPDAGLVVPQSQKVVDKLVQEATDMGALETISNTAVIDIEVENGQVRGVHTEKGFIESSTVIVTSGIWGPIVGEMAGVRVPLSPAEHPLLFFGPASPHLWEMELLRGRGEEIIYPLFRDQSNSAYVRDTGSPETYQGGMLEWGFYEYENPRLVNPRDIGNPAKTKYSPSMRTLDFEQIRAGFESTCKVVPVLNDLGWDKDKSFNGLLSVTPDNGPLMGESPEVRGLWLGEAVWVKDGPGVGKLLADWLTSGTSHIDPHAGDIARFYSFQKTPEYVAARAKETAQKIYYSVVHPREPYEGGRNIRHSPFYHREVELGGYFMELGGWERAHGYKANEERLSGYMSRVPARENEWDARHFWEVSNAEHLALSDGVGMINLSHFAIFDITGRHAERLMELLSVAKVGGETPNGKAVYTHFLDEHGGIRADITITRINKNHYRMVTGADAGNRDWLWMRNVRDDCGFDAEIHDLTNSLATLGLWGPEARNILEQFIDETDDISNEGFSFATAKEIMVCGVPVWALRISYVGELGWELYFPFSYGSRIWDAFYEAGVVPVGIETYANSRRMEKSLRLQGADLETEYNLYEAGLSRPKVKAAYFIGKEAYLKQREREHQPAYLCTMTMDENRDEEGSVRYPVGNLPILDPHTKEVLIDSLGRRSYMTSGAYGPSVGKFILLGYIPYEYAQEGRKLLLEYFGLGYTITIQAVGYRALYDPDNNRVKA